MKINRAYRVELNPTPEQSELFQRHADAARWAYNFGLGRKKEVLDLRKLPTLVSMKVPTAIDLHREVVVMKHTTHPWLTDVSKHVPQEALRDLDVAFKNFFREPRKVGFPQFKSKKSPKRSFTLGGNCPTAPNLVVVEGRRVKLPFLGWVRVKHGDAKYVPVSGMKINSATISLTAGRWFLALQVDVPAPVPKPVIGKPVVGIDLGVGVDNLLTISDGKKEISIMNPRPLRRHEKKLALLQRQLARKKDGSKRRQKAKEAVARKHFKITNIRRDFTHKVTTWLARSTSAVGVEDLSVKAMMGSHQVAKSFADASLSEVVRQLEYKSAWNGVLFVKVDPAYTSQDCSNCRRRHPEMARRNGFADTLKCECGTTLARDANASRNVRSLLLQSPEVIGRLKTPVESGSLTSVSVEPLVEAGIGFSWS